MRERIYDEVCRVLTDYETNEDGKDVYDFVMDMYEILVKIQNAMLNGEL